MVINLQAKASSLHALHDPSRLKKKPPPYIEKIAEK
ncbi:unnamed protein product [Ceutorhynchus assimilis]|uniref:Uncharacterized protein n=1 Tax=Ceutorhynchus assimilis TaxID=467358 RepID=A0A9N9MKQ2_9CUCU|nr:unnamed protein product [Ceutorhynchus assimilis]